MHPDELFVFAGAGVSLSPPSCLPLFDWLRDGVLEQLGLRDYIGDDGLKRSVVEGLAPETFMFELRAGGIDVEDWLTRTLTSTPNAAHVALAQLAAAGARVWTVNFDCLIEQVDPRLGVVAWPSEPHQPAHVLKPHGSVADG
jgi:NAD-dependent SIR2 family protein deacetylase